jgi:diacylglycerol kinase family enzyme
MRIRAIVNAEGGTLRDKDTAKQRTELTASFTEAGVAADLVLARGEEILKLVTDALEDARRQTIDAVVVGGGDGTVGCAAGVLAGTGVPLGILPLGTLNHFAKDAGLPLEVDKAAEVIARGLQRSVDVAEVNGRVFINNSSIGVYPYMVLERERHVKSRGMSKWPAMALAFARMLRRFPRRRLRILAAGSVQPCRTPCLFVGNNTYTTGILEIGRRARLDEGHLCLYIAHNRDLWGFLHLCLRAAFGRGLDEARDFDAMQLCEAEVRARMSRVPVAIDGEVEMMRPPLRYRIRPGALRLLTPTAG